MVFQCDLIEIQKWPTFYWATLYTSLYIRCRTLYVHGCERDWPVVQSSTPARGTSRCWGTCWRDFLCLTWNAAQTDDQVRCWSLQNTDSDRRTFAVKLFKTDDINLETEYRMCFNVSCQASLLMSLINHFLTKTTKLFIFFLNFVVF